MTLSLKVMFLTSPLTSLPMAKLRCRMVTRSNKWFCAATFFLVFQCRPDLTDLPQGDTCHGAGRGGAGRGGAGRQSQKVTRGAKTLQARC